MLVACGSAGLSAVGYPPAEVKSSVCGFGRADKLQVQRMVGAMLAIDLSGDPDHATDALGVAICHAVRSAGAAAAAGGRPVIASLRGTVLERRAGQVVLDVGGVGYLLQTTSSAARMSVPGEEVTLVTHLNVREDALTLYGFAESAERAMFELLLGVSGVGPKAALAIISGYAPDQVRRAIATSDHALFTSISGIGKRTAERVVIDLKDKIGALPAAEEPAPSAPAGGHTAGTRCAGRAGHVRRRGRGRAARRRRGASGRGANPAGTGRRSMSTQADRIPDPMLAPGEEELDRTLRPQRLAEFVGQDGVKEQLEIFIAAAKARNEPCEHVLLAGPPGLGKTSLAGIIAAEMGSVLRVMSGPAVDRKADMASILTRSSPATCCSSTRSTASTGRSRNCSIRRWRTAASTS